MHKGIICLIKAKDKEKALFGIKDFLKEYEGSVWDWYVIGGRWNQILAPKIKEYKEQVNQIFELSDRLLSQREKDYMYDELQKMWERLGMAGENPYCNHYKLPNDGNAYDIMKLIACLNNVKEWQQDFIKAGKENEDRAVKWINGERDRDNYQMYGYYLERAGKLYSQKFCFECKIFNIEEDNYSIPEYVDGYYAVMVDIHN